MIATIKFQAHNYFAQIELQGLFLKKRNDFKSNWNNSLILFVTFSFNVNSVTNR